MDRGTVIKSTGSWYQVYSDAGTVVQCRLRGQYRLKGLRSTNPVAVGDKVAFEYEPHGESGVITEISDRHNFIIRKATNLSKASHIIAANIDQAVLVATLDQPRTSTGFIDRFLVTAEAYHIPVMIVFNKVDLYDETLLNAMKKLEQVYQNASYETMNVSALTKQGIDPLKQRLADKVSLFSGHSGVGKSALLNAIDPALKLRTGEISTIHNKGKHTTTFAEMFQLGFGGWIVDTPGIKEFGLHDFEYETLSHRFPEMRQLMHSCKYANCTHVHEPGCAVRNAVEIGLIAGFRYHNYINMLNNDFTADN